MDEYDEYANIGAAAEMLGVSRQLVWKLIRSGRLTTIENELDRRERLIPISQLHTLIPYTRVRKAGMDYHRDHPLAGS